MENEKTHHGVRIQDLCDFAVVQLIYLPLYSCDYDPIEVAFSFLEAIFFLLYSDCSFYSH